MLHRHCTTVHVRALPDFTVGSKPAPSVYTTTVLREDRTRRNQESVRWTHDTTALIYVARCPLSLYCWAKLSYSRSIVMVTLVLMSHQSDSIDRDRVGIIVV